jgi:catechol 2,3-dioxygenase-like lactoylglutathione lyase family enzyme
MTPRLEAIGSVVADLNRSAAFYRRLGLEFPDPVDPEGHGHAEATLPSSLRFMLDTEETIRSFDPQWQPPSGENRTAIAFLCDSPAEVDRVYRELVEEAGGSGHKEPWDAFWGQRYAQVRDPDGNSVDLFARLD